MLKNILLSLALLVTVAVSYSDSHSKKPSDSTPKKKLYILTSTNTLRSLSQEIAGALLKIESLTKGKQDPHYLSAKPSYMLKANKADLLIINGLDLEVGWLPNIIAGSKNPKIQKGKQGYLDTSDFITALSVPTTKVDRFFGDIHPFGNPHFLLDPIRAIQAVKAISNKLAELDPNNKTQYIKNQEMFEKKLLKKTTEWEQRIKKSGVKKIVSYHSSFEYFLDRFDLKLTGLIEEKPGIPPSSKHILHIVKKIKQEQSFCVLTASWYQTKWAKKLKQMANILVQPTAIEVGAVETATNYILLIEGIVQSIESCKAK
ncbi:MAG: metal ABC transporter substrate-binding protein [Oligoflexia bacterium]|nr:metal ABC transporter substrate-binding protein [Oligoflexia bacterium]